MWLNNSVILHKYSGWSKWSEVKGIKKGKKINPPIDGWEGMHLSCVSVQIKKFENFG
jgi:hypothetical protein